jgi:hypothetical protein
MNPARHRRGGGSEPRRAVSAPGSFSGLRRGSTAPAQLPPRSPRTPAPGVHPCREPARRNAAPVEAETRARRRPVGKERVPAGALNTGRHRRGRRGEGRRAAARRALPTALAAVRPRAVNCRRTRRELRPWHVHPCLAAAARHRLASREGRRGRARALRPRTAGAGASRILPATNAPDAAKVVEPRHARLSSVKAVRERTIKTLRSPRTPTPPRPSVPPALVERPVSYGAAGRPTRARPAPRPGHARAGALEPHGRSTRGPGEDPRFARGRRPNWSWRKCFAKIGRVGRPTSRISLLPED